MACDHSPSAKEVQTLQLAYQTLCLALETQPARCETVQPHHQDETFSIEVFRQKIEGTGETRWLASFVPGEGRVAYVGMCQTQKVPWLALGIESLEPQDLIRIGKEVIQIPEALTLIEEACDVPSVLPKLINLGLIRGEIKHLKEKGLLSNDPIQLEELQAEADAWRSEHQLFTAEQTNNWLNERGFGQEYVEIIATERIVNRRVLNAIIGDKARAYFDSYPERFDRLCVEVVRHPSPAMATQLARLKQVEPQQWHQTCIELCLESQGQLQMNLCQWWGHQLQALLGDTFAEVRENWVNGKETPEIVGTEQQVIRILKWTPATFDETTHREARQIVLKQWLAEQRNIIPVKWLK